jgi:hypothetical protein
MDCLEIAVAQEHETERAPALVQALLRATPAEQHRLLAWSRGLRVIRRSGLRFHQKPGAMLSLTREKQATWPLVKVMLRALRILAWGARSWKFRLGIWSVVATLTAIGNEAAAIVPLGAGIGLPLWMIVGIGGLSVGLVGDALRKRLASSQATRS